MAHVGNVEPEPRPAPLPQPQPPPAAPGGGGTGSPAPAPAPGPSASASASTSTSSGPRDPVQGFQDGVLTVAFTMKLHSCVAECSDWFRHPMKTEDIYWKLYRQGEKLNIAVTTSSDLQACVKSRPLGQNFVVLCSAKAKLYSKDASWTHKGVCFMGPKRIKKTNYSYLIGSLEDLAYYPATDEYCLSVWISYLTEPALVAILRDQLSKQPAPKEPPPGAYPSVNSHLWETKDFANVTLQMDDGQEIHAHKLLLQASSPVFRAMFTHDMSEKGGVVKIRGVQTEAMKQAVRFMYTQQAECSDLDVVRGLVDVSERYQHQGLKDHCEEVLSGFVAHKPKLAFDLLPLADLYSLPKLKAYCEARVMMVVRGKEVDALDLAKKCHADSITKFVKLFLTALPTFVPGSTLWGKLKEAHPNIIEYVIWAKVHSYSVPGVAHLLR